MSIDLRMTPAPTLRPTGGTARVVLLLALGIAVGYAAANLPERPALPTSAATSDMPAPAIEDWHGNVRRSTPSN